MKDEAWLAVEPMYGLLQEVVDKTVKQYRIPRSEAERIILKTFSESQKLKRMATTKTLPEQVKRTRAFRQAVSDAKRSVYYYLRAYKPKSAELEALVETLENLSPAASGEERDAILSALLARHTSTNERVGSAHEFHRNLFAGIRYPRYVLDVGCGLYPLMFPLDDQGNTVKQYVALDKDPLVIRCVEAYARARADGRIVAFPWDVASGWHPVFDRSGRRDFDVALLLKLVPVVHRQQRELLPVLTETPARTWIVTGSRTSMTKRASIERRERAVLGEFLRLSNRELRQEFVAGDEFVWIVQ